MMPAASAFGADTGLPSVDISSAIFAPARRGNRCVPPAPGMIPSITSGWPTFASLVATRKWQACATSSPPPSALP